MDLKKVLLIATISGSVLATACKKSGGDQQSAPSEPIKTAKGTLKAGLITKSIGPAGGELVSTDGNIRIIVPPNAVQSNTEFGIQPITNTLYDEAPSKAAYRLLPEGKQFAQPVKIVLKYDESDLEGTAEDFLAIAWQKDDGTWKLEPTRLDKQANTLTVESTHFSDWTQTGGFELRVDHKDLRPKEQANIRVFAATDDDLLATLSLKDEELENITHMGNWTLLKGSGSLEKITGNKGFETAAIYTAPSSINGIEMVEVSMQVEGFNQIKDPSSPDGVRHTGKMILVAYLTVSNNMLIGKLDGIDFGFFGDEVVATGLGNTIAIRASGENGAGGEITIVVSTAGTGYFPCGPIYVPGKAAVNVYSPAGGPNYATSYFECGQAGELKFTNSTVEISKWPTVGQATLGSFSGLVYVQDGQCGARSKNLELRFNIIRSA
ncbi:MAG: hypothetical protein J7578_03420 [Chitinophagaceae bacterium]|nr:hypothetical protein [Chitinophagaceae bacterium]